MSIDFIWRSTRRSARRACITNGNLTKLYVEPGISPEILEGLVKRGYKVVPTPPQTSANSIEITADGYVGAADRRTRGSLAAGY